MCWRGGWWHCPGVCKSLEHGDLSSTVPEQRAHHLRGRSQKSIPVPGTFPGSRAAAHALAHTQCHHLCLPALGSLQASQDTEHSHCFQTHRELQGWSCNWDSSELLGVERVVLGLLLACLGQRTVRDGHGGNGNEKKRKII